MSDLSSEIKDNKVIAKEEIVDPPPSKGPLVPPSSSTSQNLADAAGLQSESAMLNKQESNYLRSQSSSANISKEVETKETKDKSVSETTVNASYFASSVAITLLTLGLVQVIFLTFNVWYCVQVRFLVLVYSMVYLTFWSCFSVWSCGLYCAAIYFCSWILCLTFWF